MSQPKSRLKRCPYCLEWLARTNCELEALLSEKPMELNIRSHLHNRRPYRDPSAQPVKWMKLIQWWLVHRVPIDAMITPDTEAAACLRFNIPEWKWEEAKKRFPSLLPKVNYKRLRRMEYALETGRFPPKGWTPPDPKNGATQNVAPYTRFWKHWDLLFGLKGEMPGGSLIGRESHHRLPVCVR